MKKILDFFNKYSLIINIVLFVLTFALFFLPLYATPKFFLELGMSGYNPIMHIVQNGIDVSDSCLDYCVVYLLFFILTWILQIVNIILSKKKPMLSIWTLISFSGIYIYTIYLFAANKMAPHIGFILMTIIFCFYLFELIVYIIVNIKPHEHKPTNT